MKRSKWYQVVVLLALCAIAASFVPASATPAAPTATWNVISTGLTPLGSLNAVAMGAGNDVWAVGDKGQVYHYDGTTWSTLVSGTDLDLNAVSPVPGQVGTAWVVGVGAGGANPSTVRVCEATSGGGTCTQQAGVPTTGALDAVWALSSNDVWVVGDRIILHYIGNATWETILEPNSTTSTVPKVQYHSVQMLGNGTGWAVGEPETPGGLGTILHYDSQAVGWQQITSGPPAGLAGPLRGLWFLPSGEGLAVGGVAGSPALVLYHAAGSAADAGWTSETAAMEQPTLFWGVCLLPDGAAYAVGNGGQIFARSQSGQWVQDYVMATGTAVPFYAVWMLPDASDGWVVGGNTPAQPGTPEFIFLRTTSGPHLTPRIYLPAVIR